MIKNTFLFFIAYFLIFPISPTLAIEDKSQYFIVTAYYSPLPDQDFYIKWSYENDKKLNWEWLYWASWKQVFNWMLAWPKKYDFWTQIYLEWIWTWVIEDRGWAIVESWERGYDADRIDVWMWHWDEWLKKSLAWWKRKIQWKIIEIENSELKVDNVWINFNPTNLVSSQIKKSNNEYIYNVSVWINSRKSDIVKLQTKLSWLSVYKWEIDWIYNKKLINSLVSIQIKNWIIKSDNEDWAWYWWVKTRNYFYKNEKELSKPSSNTIIVQETTIESDSLFDTYIHPSSSKDNVKKLQSKLNEMEIYKWEINWKYSDVINTLIEYQLSKNIINSKNNDWAWYFWPKTRSSLRNDFNKFLVKKEEEKRDRRKLDEIKNLALEKASNKLDEIWTPKLWEISQNVRELQKILITLWYFKWKDTAIYWELTKQSILAYQIDKNLIQKDWDPWSGKIWEITKWEIKKDLVKLFLEKKLREENLMAYNYKAWK